MKNNLASKLISKAPKPVDQSKLQVLRKDYNDFKNNNINFVDIPLPQPPPPSPASPVRPESSNISLPDVLNFESNNQNLNAENNNNIFSYSQLNSQRWLDLQKSKWKRIS